jgi:hypothetical protein
MGRMIRVSVEVHSATTQCRVAVWAKSIERAIALVRGRYPGGEAKVLFPIEPEAFFTKDLVPASGLVRPQTAEQLAG